MKALSLVLLIFAGTAIAQTDLANLKDSELKDELHRITGENYVSLSYKEARIKLFNVIYLEKDDKGYFNTDVYCDARFDRKFKNDIPDEELPDANKFNTEHTWAQSRFNDALDQEVQKTDLHHLYPTLNKINSERANYEFANVGVPVTKPLSCKESKLGSSLGYAKGIFFEPPDAHKGNVARSLFYFSVRYQIAIQPNEEIFLKFWHMLDPVDEQERARHELKATFQKNRNPFIDHPELVLQISDF